MNLLIFNCGSSSLNYKLVQTNGEPGSKGVSTLLSGKAYHVGVRCKEDSYLVHRGASTYEKQSQALHNHREAAQAILEFLQKNHYAIEVIGHRFVHGGEEFRSTTLITPQTRQALERCTPLAPIHNPNSLSVIDLCSQLLPGARQFAAFDTAFHSTLTEEAYRYALPFELAESCGLRKYGFHGLSYQSICLQASQFLSRPQEDLRLVACHLGTGGSSAAAIRGGRSVDTTMGYSPLAGLIMSTRCGDLDPAIVLEMIEHLGYTPEEVSQILNHESGLLGISGETSDLFELIKLARSGRPRATLAVDMYVHRLKSAIGSMLAAVGGADVLVFTDDIGVRAWQIRQQACADMAWCGIQLDATLNRQAPADQITRISAPGSAVEVLSIPTDEETIIALEGLQLLKDV